MNVDVDTDDEVNLIKDVRARSNACYKCGEMGHFQRDCKYDGDKPSDNWQEQDGTFDMYDPVVGKWMIQEITEELQAIEEESLKEDQDSDATQVSDLEQEDSDIPLTKDEQ